MRRLIAAVTPPVLLELFRGAGPDRTMPSWQAAVERAGSYQADLVNRFRADRAAGRTADGALLQQSVLGLVAPLVGRSDLSVTDLGGATGDLGADFLAAHPQSRYVVVENPTMVELMRGRSPCVFATELPPSCDIFYSSSTLQYLPDPLGAWAAGLASARHYAILVRNSFSSGEEFRVQTSHLFDNGNGPLPAGYENVEISYPHRTLNEDHVIAKATASGFRCVARLEESSGARPGTFGRQMVFRRQAEETTRG